MDGDAEVSGQLPGSISCRDPEQPGYEGNHISLSTTAEAMESPTQLQTGRVVIVEGSPCHSGSIHFQPIPFRSIHASDAVFQRLKVTHSFSPFGFVISQATHLPSDPVCSAVKLHERNKLFPSPTRQRDGFCFSLPSLGWQRNGLFSQARFLKAISFEIPGKPIALRTLLSYFFVLQEKTLSPIA